MDKFKNRSLGILTAGINNTATSLTLQAGQGAKFPDPSVDGPFYAQIYRSDYGSPALAIDAGEAEWILVTARLADVFTFERAKKGDTARNLNTATKIYYLVAGPQAETFEEIRTKLALVDFNRVEIGNVWGAGQGICPEIYLPSSVVPMAGCYDKSYGNANYGNYKCVIDNSQMVYIPAFVFKITGNIPVIKSFKDYDYDVNAAAADGYALWRSFINGGKNIAGKFVDKTMWSMTNFVNGISGIASSVIGGNPITSSTDALRDATNNFAGAFSNCKSNGQSPLNIYGGAFATAKSRGNDFYPEFLWDRAMLAILMEAQAAAVTSTSFCAWYDSTGVKNFAKGDNNYGADVNDPTVTFAACDDGYWSGRNEARKTGGANNISKTTHNGQSCGVTDMQGNQYAINPGLTCIATTKNITAITRAAQAVFTTAAHGWSTGQIVMLQGSATTEWNNLLQYQFADVEVIDANTYRLKKRTNDVNNGAYLDTSALTADYVGTGFTAATGIFYSVKESCDVTTLTGGNTLATDHWGAVGVAANFEVIDLSDLLVNKYTTDRFGSGGNQVFGMSTDRTTNVYRLTMLGLPESRSSFSSSGTNQFGTDMFYKFIVNEVCAFGGGNWNDTSNAGPRYVSLRNTRTYSNSYVSSRSCLNAKML